MALTPTTSTASSEGAPAANVPKVRTEASAAGVLPSADPLSSSSDTTERHPELVMANRVARVQREIEAGREVPDDDLLQHMKDCTYLQESAYDRFELSGDPAHRQQAVDWTRRREAAQRCLSPQFQAAREAEILSRCSAGHFIDAGDADRAGMASNEERRG